MLVLGLNGAGKTSACVPPAQLAFAGTRRSVSKRGFIISAPLNDACTRLCVVVRRAGLWFCVHLGSHRPLCVQRAPNDPFGADH